MKLIDAIRMQKPKEYILLLMNEKDCNFDEIDDYKQTPLILACANKFDNDIVIKLIEKTKKLDNVDYLGRTALIWMCYNEFSENIIIKLIETGNAKPEQVDSEGNTALTWSCDKKLSDNIIFKLIDTNNSKPEQVNIHSYCALSYAIMHNLENISIKLINTNNVNVGHIGKSKDNLLMTALFVKASDKLINKLLDTKKINLHEKTFSKYREENGYDPFLNILQLACLYKTSCSMKTK